MVAFGRLLIILGAVLLGTGAIVFILGKSGFNLSRFPGNIRIELGNMTCVAALGLSVVLTILLTVVLNLIAKFLNR